MSGWILGQVVAAVGGGHWLAAALAAPEPRERFPMLVILLGTVSVTALLILASPLPRRARAGRTPSGVPAALAGGDDADARAGAATPAPGSSALAVIRLAAIVVLFATVAGARRILRR